jgi:cytochrome c-type biogenesis protein CcmE
MKKITTLCLFILAISAGAFAQTPKTITQLRTNDANGLPNGGDTATQIMTTGIVYGPNTNKYRTTGGMTFILNDHQAGIKVYATRSFGYTFHEGDSVMVIGTCKNFRGEAELDARYSNQMDSIIYLGPGTLDAPTVVSQLDEQSESKLIKLLNIDMSTVVAGTSLGQWGINPAYSNFTAWFGPGSVNNAIFIDSFMSYALYTMPKPTGIYNIVGFGAQFKSTAPFTATGYQIIPRSPADFIPVSGIDDVNNDVLAASVYPNPASTKVGVSLNGERDETVTTRIFDIAGREVMTQSDEISKGANFLTYDVKNLQSGIYVVDVRTATKSLVTKVSIEK